MSDRVLTPEELRAQDVQRAHVRSHLSRAHRFSNESPLSASSLGPSPRAFEVYAMRSRTGQVPSEHTVHGNQANPRNQGLHPISFGQMQQSTTAPQIPGTTAPQVPGTTAPQIPGTTANPTTTVAAAEQKPKKPITTVLSLLPKTTYKEVSGAEGTEDTLAFLKVQRDLLKYLDTKPADALTAEKACHWTESISAKKQPRSRDALRLCYYMRSQTFDTYADVKDEFISLYVANQNTNVRGPRTDKLYWRQSIKNNQIKYRATVATTSGHLSTGILGDVMARLISRDRSANLSHPRVPARTANDNRLVDSDLQEMLDREQEVEEEDEAGDEDDDDDGDDDEEDDAEPAQNNLTAQITRAEINLHRLMASEPYDADAVNAALMQIEELNHQLDTE